MPVWFILIPVLLPVLSGALIPLFHFQTRTARQRYTAGAVLLNSLLLGWMIAFGSGAKFVLLTLTPHVDLALRMDGLSKVFLGLLALLWPLATIYAFEYMEHEKKQTSFFTWYTMTFGVAVGVALAQNLVTMYLFYELLTLITLPIIMHEMDSKALHAGRKYLLYSIGGAACAFLSIMILQSTAGATDFTWGGLLTWADVVTQNRQTEILIAYLLGFFGFGVKAAVWPLHGWLPAAGVAPTPVTALLHAVAVVKAGVFAIIRLTYFGYGVSSLKGTYAQYLPLAAVCITIVYGSVMAVREQHLKRRLAYSTISNLSYILLGVMLMTQEGLGAGLMHLLFHGVMKICLFFGAGAVICKTQKEYLRDMKGLGRRMPFTFGCFTVASLALIGVPGLCGFVSKWYLAEASIGSGTILGWVGVGALICSAVLTAIYLFTVILTVFAPEKELEAQTAGEERADPHWFMKLPMAFLCLAMLVLGLFSGPLVSALERIGSGLPG